MYEALVARIRYHIQKANFMGLKEAESTLLLAEAADSIEELSRKYIEERNAAVELTGELASKPRWIPVTERLPDEGRYLALTTPSVNGGEPYARILRFSENLESVDRYDFEGINRSGWYYYDDEFGHIEVVTVNNWMPLPQPPKEE